MFPFFEQRPILIAIAGPNGAGKTTFYRTFLSQSGLHFINADRLTLDFNLSAYEAADLASRIRKNLTEIKESFIFETVFSDPVGDKLSFLKAASKKGYTVVLIFIGLSSPAKSEERVNMRRLQGEHDVPVEKLKSRFPRTMLNLQKAINELPFILVYDNDDLANPFQLIASFENGVLIERISRMPGWFRRIYNDY